MSKLNFDELAKYGITPKDSQEEMLNKLNDLAKPELSEAEFNHLIDEVNQSFKQSVTKTSDVDVIEKIHEFLEGPHLKYLWLGLSLIQTIVLFSYQSIFLELLYYGMGHFILRSFLLFLVSAIALYVYFYERKNHAIKVKYLSRQFSLVASIVSLLFFILFLSMSLSSTAVNLYNISLPLSLLSSILWVFSSVLSREYIIENLDLKLPRKETNQETLKR